MQEVWIWLWIHVKKNVITNTIACAKARKHGWHQVCTDGENSIEKRWGRQVAPSLQQDLALAEEAVLLWQERRWTFLQQLPIYHLCALLINAFIIVGVRNMCCFNSLYSWEKGVAACSLCVFPLVFRSFRFHSLFKDMRIMLTGDSKQPVNVSVDGCGVGNVSRM